MSSSPAVSPAVKATQPAAPPPADKTDGRFKSTLNEVASKENVKPQVDVEQRVEQPQPKTDKRIAQAKEPDIELTVIGVPPEANVWDRSTWFPEFDAGSWKTAFLERPEWAALGISTTPGATDATTSASNSGTQAIGDQSVFRSSGRTSARLDQMEGRTFIAEPFSPKLAPIMLDALYGTQGLTETTAGVYRLNGTPDVKSSDLPAGTSGTAGVLDAGGAVRSFISYPATAGRNVIDIKAQIGTRVEKGDLLYVERNPAVEAERDKVGEQLQASEGGHRNGDHTRAVRDPWPRISTARTRQSDRAAVACPLKSGPP